MSGRGDAESIVTQLHAARLRGDVAGMCTLFASKGRFEIAGTSADKPIAIEADGIEAFKPWLGMLVRVFRLSNYQMLSTVVELPNVVVHWSAAIHSKVTGVTVAAELVDLVTIEGGRIVAYREIFLPR